MKTSLSRIVAALLFLVMGSVANAQDYPNRPIVFVVPFAVGSGTDLAARFVSAEISKILKVPVVVENKPGADGIIATKHVLAQPADGYSVLMTANTTHVINPNLYKELAYDPVKDFTPISRVIQIQYVVVARPGLGVKNITELLELAKNRPERINYGSGNASSQVGSSILAHASGVPQKFSRIGYPGMAQALVDVIGDRVDFIVTDLASSRSAVSSKQVVPLAVISEKRAPEMPDVPTIGEAGIKAELIGWVGGFVSSSTPQPIVDKLNAAFVQALNMPEAKTYYGNLGVTPWPSTSNEMRDFVIREIKTWGAYMEAAGMEKK